MKIRVQLPESFDLSLFPVGKGIELSGKTAVFDGDWNEDKAIEFCAQVIAKTGDGWHIKQSKRAKIKQVYTSSDVPPAILSKFNQQLPGKKAENFLFVPTSSANTRIDRDEDFFTKNYLEGMAISTNHEILMSLVDHNPTKTIGRVFHAEVQPISDGAGNFELIEWHAIAKEIHSPNHAGTTMERAFELGLYDFVSVRTRPKKVERVEVEPGKYANKFDTEPGQRVEHSETSFVFMGAQYDARAKTALKAEIIHDKPKKEMEKTFQIGGKSLTVKVDGDNVTLSGVDEIEKTTGQVEDLKKSVESLQKQVDEIKQPDVNNILNLQKKLEISEGAQFSEDEVKSWDLPRVKAYSEDLSKRYATANPTTGKPSPGKEDEGANIYGE